jgi:hypothetical protein
MQVYGEHSNPPSETSAFVAALTSTSFVTRIPELLGIEDGLIDGTSLGTILGIGDDKSNGVLLG